MSGVRPLTPLGDAPLHLDESIGGRLLLEGLDLAEVVEAEDPHVGGVEIGDRLGGDRDVGAALDVRVDQLAEVHPVEMIAGKD